MAMAAVTDEERAHLEDEHAELAALIYKATGRKL